MTPLNNNDPYIDSTGKRSTLGAEIAAGGGGGYTLPTASSDIKGGVKVGSGLSMDGEVLNATPYSLPTASDSTKGGVKVGSGLSMDGEVLSATPYSLPTASDSTKGGVKVGSGLTMDGEVLKLADAGMKIYYKDFTNLTWESIITIVESSLYYHTTASGLNLNVDGYSPIGGIAIDVYTGYRCLGAVELRPYSGVQKAGTFSIINTRSDNDGIYIRMFYVKNEDIEALT